MTLPPNLAHQPADVAVSRLVEEHGGKLYHLALKFCGNPADAEDLVQQTFLLAFRKWSQFKGDAAPTTWLYTIAARQCQRSKRRRVGEPRRLEPIDTLLPSSERQIVDLPSDVDGPLDAQIRREAVAALERGIARLPTPLRMALVLKDIVELPVADVSQVLGLKPATVKTRVHRARLMLRRTIAQTLPRKDAAPPDHAKQVCLDLLTAKQDALDRGVDFPVPQREVCERCRALFATLDLGVDMCQEVGRVGMSPALRRSLQAAVASTGRPASDRFRRTS
jgi:RNA polymerase sigma-70 factor (ECF subfamily)